jgi:hypothetical protein
MRSLATVGKQIEQLAKQQDGQSIGAQVAAILDGKASGPRLTDEELARTKVGRLLLERRRRTEADYPG